MAYSYIEYVGDGSTKTFNIPFTYLKQADVKVYVGGVDTAFTFTSASVVSLATAPASGVVVRLARTTDASTRAVDFQDGSVLSESDLDNSADQVFKIAQEAIDKAGEGLFKTADGLFDAQSRRIKNVADPVNDQDAVTKKWATTASDAQVQQATAQATAAASSAAQAAASQSSAASSAATATTKAGEASTSATNAANSASTASTKATEAAASASTATTKAGEASASATTATTKASEAASSATSASGSAAAANTSASSAAGSASTATTKAGEASTSASNAAGSASAAATSATSAGNSATNAQTSATNSANSATASANSASAAATSATNAANSATASANSATTATTQASTATTKASEAAASAVSAANSAAAAATALDNFDDRYLGQKTADPTLDNDGMALLTGALYFNTTTGKMRVYTGSGWIDASSASVATLATFNYVATASQTTFSGNDAAGVNLVYTVGALIVTLNGIDQKNGVDYTASNGSSIVLTSGAAAGDELRVYAFGNFQVADTYSQAAANALLAQKLDKAGGTMTGQLVLQSAALDIQSGQIKFPSTQSASSDANTLDDYEEGSWTPVLSTAGGDYSSITMLNQGGSYIKIGKKVSIWIVVATSGSITGGSGTVVIKNLPFPVNSAGIGSIWVDPDTGAYNSPTALPTIVRGVGGSTLIALAKNGATSHSPFTELYKSGGNANSMQISLTYTTTA